MSDNLKIQGEVSLDTTNADQALVKVEKGASRMAEAVGNAGKKAGAGLSEIGNGGDASAAKVDKATNSIVASIQRATALMEAGSKSSAKYYETLANQRGVSVDALRPYLDQLEKVQQSQNKVGVSAAQTAAAMRNVPAQFTDIITSLQGGQAPLTVFLQQGGQLKDMFGGAGNAAKALGTYVLGLINPLTLAGAAGLALAVAYNQGSKEAQEYAKALILTGNAAGTTTDQLATMAAKINEAGNGTKAASAEALAALAGTGKVGVANLENFAATTLNVEKIIGKSVQDTVKEFAELGKSPVEASLKLNEQYNYLTASVYKQIKALEDQGKAFDAAELAQKTYEGALSQRTAGIKQNLGTIERGWNSVKSSAKEAWDSMLGIGRETTKIEEIAKLQANIKSRNQFISTERPGSLLIPKAQADNEVDKQRLVLLEAQVLNAQKFAKIQGDTNKIQQAGMEFEKQGVQFLDKKGQMQIEINKATQLYLQSVAGDNTRSKEDKEKDKALTDRIIAIKEKYKESLSKEENAYQSLAKSIREKVALSELELKADKPLTESQKLRVKLMEVIASGHGKITQAQIAEQNNKINLIQSNELLTATYKKLYAEIDKLKPEMLRNEASILKEIDQESKKATEQTKKWMQEQRDNYESVNNSLDDYASRMQETNELAQLEIDLLGRSSVERKTLVEQRKIELALEREIEKLRKMNLTDSKRQELIDKATNQADIDKSTAQLRARQSEWTKFYEDIYSGLSDSLYRGFEAGKGFFQSFWDGIKNLFKTTVLKLAVQGVMTGVLGMGANGMANAQGLGAQGGLSSISTVYSMGKSLWDGFSAAGTIGGGVTTLGNALGSSTLSAFGSGMSLSSSQAASAAAAYNGAGMTGTGTAISAGSSAAAAVPIVGWVLAGMAANNSLFDQGWGGKASNSTKQLGIASGMVGGAFENTIQKMFGLSDKTASMLTGSAVVNRLFGYKNPELQQSELSANFGGDSVSAQIRDVYKQQGGVFRGDKWSETKNSVAGDQLKNLNGMFDSIKLAAAGYADVLGLSSDTIKNFTKEVKVNLSITGDAAKDAEANGKIWADLIGGVADDLSKYLMPSLADFAKEGEKSGDTFARIAANIGGVNAAFSDLNLTLFKTSDVGIKAASNFVDLFGGLDKFQAASQSYYQNFYTQEERNANVVKSLTAELEKQNLILPSSRDGYRALVEEVSKTGSPEQLASLFKLSEAFASVFEGADSLSVDLPIFVNAATSYASALDAQFVAQRKIEAASIAATQALEAQAKATETVARAESQKAYDDSLQGRLRSGKVSEIMSSNYELNPVDFGKYVSGGQFNAGGFNDELLRQKAKLSLDLIAKASADAINVEDVASVIGGLFDFTKGDEFRNLLRRSLPGATKSMGYVMSDFMDAAIDGFRQKQYGATGSGIVNVINAQDQIGYQADLLTQYSRSLTSAGEALRLGIVTQDQYNGAISQANEILKDQIQTQESLNDTIKKAGVDSIAFYFDQIGLSVERLNAAAEKAAEPLSVVTSAIGRFTSISDVFGLSANAAGDFAGNADLVAQSAKIAAQVLTTQSAAQAAKELATKASFSGQSASHLRDLSLLIEGVRQFDPSSFESSFLRISDALNKGVIDQAQYQDLFSTSLNMFDGVESESNLLAKSMGNLRDAMSGFADGLLIDKSRTTLSDSARMQEVMRQYDAAKVGAMSGDASSISLFQSLGNQLATRDNYSSRAEANYGFSRVLADSQNLARYADQKTSSEKQTAAIQSMEKSMNERMDKQFGVMLAQLKELQDSNINQIRASLPA